MNTKLGTLLKFNNFLISMIMKKIYGIKLRCTITLLFTFGERRSLRSKAYQTSLWQAAHNTQHERKILGLR